MHLEYKQNGKWLFEGEFSDTKKMMDHAGSDPERHWRIVDVDKDGNKYFDDLKEYFEKMKVTKKI